MTFKIRAGERWLLHGPNGAGKTVLLKLLRGDLWPTPCGVEARRYHMTDGEVLSQPLGASERIAYLGPERQDRYERYESELTSTQVVHTGFDDSDFPLAAADRSRNDDASTHVLEGRRARGPGRAQIQVAVVWAATPRPAGARTGAHDPTCCCSTRR